MIIINNSMDVIDNSDDLTDNIIRPFIVIGIKFISYKD